jgi:ubiquinone biosynthesis protein
MRFLSVAARAVSIMLRSGWHGLLFFLIDLPRALARRRGGQAAVADRLARLLVSLGPTAVKAGQILSARPDLLAPAFLRALAPLQDRMPALPERVARAEVERALGAAIEQLFDAFDPVPVAAASIAQVHWARLRDGREVAVKIRRPEVPRLLELDFRLASTVAGLVARLPFMRLTPVGELAQEIMLPIWEQVDFGLEAENNRRLRRHFAHVERIAIPALVDEYCAESVLVMEYFGGLRKIGETDFGPAQSRALATAGLRALYRMIFVNGFIHADLHPGNLLVRDGCELAMLDTGLAVALPDGVRMDFVDFFFALVNDEGAECARIMERNATALAPGYRRDAFEAEIAALISRHASLKSRDFEIAAFVYELIAAQRRHGVRGSTAFMMTVLAMAVYDGVCKHLYPDCDFQKEARPFLIAGRYGGRRLAVRV